MHYLCIFYAIGLSSDLRCGFFESLGAESVSKMMFSIGFDGHPIQYCINKLKKCINLWGFDTLYSFGLSRPAYCMIISQNNDCELDCLHINIKKNQCLNNTQIKIRFYDSFHYLNTLLRCDFVCDRLNTNHLMTSRHN